MAITVRFTTIADIEFVVRILERERRRAERNYEPGFVPEPGKRDANLNRIEHITELITQLRDALDRLSATPTT